MACCAINDSRQQPVRQLSRAAADGMSELHYRDDPKHEGGLSLSPEHAEHSEGGVLKYDLPSPKSVQSMNAHESNLPKLESELAQLDNRGGKGAPARASPRSKDAHVLDLDSKQDNPLVATTKGGSGQAPGMDSSSRDVELTIHGEDAEAKEDTEADQAALLQDRCARETQLERVSSSERFQI